MNRWKNRLVTATAILLLAGSLVLAKTNFASAGNGNDTIIVANTEAQPVPVTGAVAISNLPLVQNVIGRVSIENLPPVQAVTGSVNVGNLPAVQEVAGAVSVSNLPAVQQVAGTVNVAERALVHGSTQIWLSQQINQRYTILPADVVVTDVRVEFFPDSGTTSCEVWLAEETGNYFGSATMLRGDSTHIAELHLESGFAANPDTVERGFFMNSDCTARVFWSGYHAAP